LETFERNGEYFRTADKCFVDCSPLPLDFKNNKNTAVNHKIDNPTKISVKYNIL